MSNLHPRQHRQGGVRSPNKLLYISGVRSSGCLFHGLAHPLMVRRPEPKPNQVCYPPSWTAPQTVGPENKGLTACARY